MTPWERLTSLYSRLEEFERNLSASLVHNLTEGSQGRYLSPALLEILFNVSY